MVDLLATYMRPDFDPYLVSKQWRRRPQGYDRYGQPFFTEGMGPEQSYRQYMEQKRARRAGLLRPVRSETRSPLLGHAGIVGARLSAYGGGVVVLPWEGVVLSALALDPGDPVKNNDVIEAFDGGVMVRATEQMTITPAGP